MWLFAEVGPFMPGHVALYRETLPTQIALERLLSSVGPLMRGQGALR